MRYFCFITAIVLAVLSGSANSTELALKNYKSVEEIIDAVDRLYRADHSYSEIEMEVITPHWKRTISMKAWAQGLEKTFIRISSPQKDRGIATLRAGNEMWNYFPKIDKVMKIPPSMMMGSWMGSDFTNDDLVKESSRKNDYIAKLLKPENADKDLYYIEQIPRKKTATVWGKILSVVRKADLIPVKEEYYDEHGVKVRILDFTEVKILGGRHIPTAMVLTPLNKKGKKTIIRYKVLDYSKGGDNKIYTLRNLQKKS